MTVQHWLGGKTRMSSAGSVTEWISQLKAGDATAAQKLLERYFPRLRGLARKKLAHKALGIADEEDVALSALAGFFLSAERGQFTDLHNRDDLWQLLVVITTRKAFDLLHYAGARKRDKSPGHNGSPGHAPPCSTDKEPDVERVIDSRLAPDVEVLLDDECRRLLDRLRDATLRSIAVWKLEGYTNEDIAALLGCALRTVERKLRRIRNIWGREAAE